MPTYVYACQGCREVIERRQSFTDEPLTVCDDCGGELRRVIQPVGIIFNRATPPASEREPAPVAATTVETKAEAPATETATAGSTPPATPAAAPAASAPAKEAAPTKEAAVKDGPAKAAPAKEPAPVAKEAPAPEPQRPPDDGHKPAQRGSRWTTFIR